jgi:hypothetical protein
LWLWRRFGGYQLAVGDTFGLLTNTTCDFQCLLSCHLEGVPRENIVVMATQQFTLGITRLPWIGTQLVRVIPLVAPEDNIGA